jgi:hypothetical protein
MFAKKKETYLFPFWGGVGPSPLLLGPMVANCTSPGWWMMMSVEQSVERELAGGIEVLGENLPYCRCVHHKSHMT